VQLLGSRSGRSQGRPESETALHPRTTCLTTRSGQTVRTPPFRVLLVDDDKDEESLTRSLLRSALSGPAYLLDWSRRSVRPDRRSPDEKHDAYLIDHNLGLGPGRAGSHEARQSRKPRPPDHADGATRSATDLAALDAGATDFLVGRGRQTRRCSTRTIRYSISHAAMVWALDRLRNQMAGLEEIGANPRAGGPTRQPSIASWS